MDNMHTTPYVHSTTYTTCTLHHVYRILHIQHGTTMNIQHVHSTICTKHCISNIYIVSSIPSTLYAIYIQHHIYNRQTTSCTQYYICYMYTIPILNILRPHYPCQMTLLLLSYPCVSLHVAKHMNFIPLMYPST